MPEPLELERYELREPPFHTFEPDRRDFVKLLGGGIVVLLAAGDAVAQESGARGRTHREPLPETLSAWLHIAPDGTITVYTGKAEMGQNIRTSLTQAVAEELRVAPGAIPLVMADTARTPFDLGTFGSRTTPTMAPQLHKAGATAREMLLAVAASKWKCDRTALAIAKGTVGNTATGASASYGELAREREAAVTIPADAPVTPATEWKIAGTDEAKISARDIVTGRHKYTCDMSLPGMLYGKVVRPPAFHSKLVSVDTSAAGRMRGVTVVHDGDFLAVASADPEVLPAAAAAIKANWHTPDQISTKDLFTYLRTHPAEANRAAGEADPPKQPAESGHAVAATYLVSYIQHVPLETRAALAQWKDGRVEVWTGSQRPFGVRTELAQAFSLPEDHVHVIVPDTGAAYGGKHTGDAAVEAARIAKGAGKPVKLVWTREEEFTWAYFRPAGVIDVRGAADANGAITHWEMDNYNSGPSAVRSHYNIANERAEFHETEYPLRQGSYRALAATANHFARESHIDELAHSVGMDPLAFRLKNISDPRLRAVLEAAAQRFGWNNSSRGKACGMSCGFEKGGYIATFAEVSTSAGATMPRVLRAVQAFECGAVVNPEHLRNSITGAIMMGIGGALFEAIDFADGRVLNARLSQYRVPRFEDAPDIEVVLVNRKDLPSSGAGETPIVGIAPAIANAVFAGTGRRLRQMPLRLA